jgi:hypothetical protein
MAFTVPLAERTPEVTAAPVALQHVPEPESSNAQALSCPSAVSTCIESVPLLAQPPLPKYKPSGVPCAVSIGTGHEFPSPEAVSPYTPVAIWVTLTLVPGVVFAKSSDPSELTTPVIE